MFFIFILLCKFYFYLLFFQLAYKRMGFPTTFLHRCHCICSYSSLSFCSHWHPFSLLCAFMSYRKLSNTWVHMREKTYLYPSPPMTLPFLLHLSSRQLLTTQFFYFHETCNLGNDRDFLLTVLEADKLKVKEPEDPVFSEGSVHSSEMTPFVYLLHLVTLLFQTCGQNPQDMIVSHWSPLC